MVGEHLKTLLVIQSELSVNVIDGGEGYNTSPMTMAAQSGGRSPICMALINVMRVAIYGCHIDYIGVEPSREGRPHDWHDTDHVGPWGEGRPKLCQIPLDYFNNRSLWGLILIVRCQLFWSAKVQNDQPVVSHFTTWPNKNTT